MPGGSLATALAVESFEDIDDHLRRRECPCGGLYEVRGEGARVEGDARLRLVRVECMRCERNFAIYFDVTRLFQ